MFNDVFKGDSSLTTIDHDLRAKKKRVVSSALSDNSLSGIEELVLRSIRKFTKRLGEPAAQLTAGQDGPEGESWSSPKTMTNWADYLSFDVMGDFCFSGPFEMLDKEDSRFVLRVLPEGVNDPNMVGTPIQSLQSLLSLSERLDAWHLALEARQSSFREAE